MTRYDSELKGLRYGSIMIMADQARRSSKLTAEDAVKPCSVFVLGLMRFRRR